MCPGDSPWHDPDPVSSFACGFEKRHVAQPQTLRLAAGCEIHTQAQYRHCNAPGFQNTILFLLSEYYIEYIVEFREEFIFGGSLNKTRIHPYVCFCVAHAVTILLSICCGLCLTAFSLVCNTLWMNMLVSVCMAQDGHCLSPSKATVAVLQYARFEINISDTKQIKLLNTVQWDSEPFLPNEWDELSCVKLQLVGRHSNLAKLLKCLYCG